MWLQASQGSKAARGPSTAAAATPSDEAVIACMATYKERLVTAVSANIMACQQGQEPQTLAVLESGLSAGDCFLHLIHRASAHPPTIPELNIFRNNVRLCSESLL